MSPDEVARRHADSRGAAVKEELDKAKRRREERLAEQQLWEEERARMSRESEGMDAWGSFEHSFVLLDFLPVGLGLIFLFDIISRV